MTSDEDLLALANFLFNRFDKYLPDEQELIEAIEDWKREAF